MSCSCEGLICSLKTKGWEQTCYVRSHRDGSWEESEVEERVFRKNRKSPLGYGEQGGVVREDVGKGSGKAVSFIHHVHGASARLDI